MDHIEAMRAYVRAVELESFTRAADELGVKQSTVSKWIGALEEELGVTLLQRSSRALRVTPEGELFHARCKAMLSLYDEARAELSASAGELRGRLKVSLPVVIGQRLLVGALLDFAQTHPMLELELVLEDRYVELLTGGFDLALRLGAPADSSLHAVTLAHSARWLVASPGYLAERGEPRHPDELSRGGHLALLHTLVGAEPWRLRAPDGEWVKARCAEVRRASNHSEVIVEMARRGMGIAALSSWLVEEEVARGELVRLLHAYELPQATLQALAPSSPLPQRARLLVDHLRDRLASQAM